MRQPFSFIPMLKAEHYKAKNNIGILLVLLCPLVVIMGVYLWLMIDFSIYPEGKEYVTNPWIKIAWELYFLYIFCPLLVSVMTYSLCDMEYQNRNFKRLFTLPYPVHVTYTAKIVFLIEIILASSLIAYFCFLLGGNISGHIFPALTFQDYDIRLACFYFHSRMFINLLAVAFIQFGVSLMFRNFFIPVGFGCLMTVISAVMVIFTSKTDLSPYGSILKSLKDFVIYQNESFGMGEYASLICIFIFLVINFFLFRRQKTTA